MADLLKPDDWDITTRLSLSHYSLSIIFFNDGDYHKADKLLSIAIKFNNKGNNYNHVNIKCIWRVLQLVCMYIVCEYYVLRGRARYYIGDFHGSLADYTEAHRLNPESKEVQRYYFQFSSMNALSGGDDVRGMVITNAQLPQIALTTTNNKKKAIRRVKADRSYLPEVSALQEQRLVVDSMRTIELKRDEQLWGMLKSVSSLTLTQPTQFASSSINSKAARSYSKYQLRDASAQRTREAMLRPERLLLGVRSCREDLDYNETKPPTFKVATKKR
jgi:tetratricopeptide (TPR) repeat protein